MSGDSSRLARIFGTLCGDTCVLDPAAARVRGHRGRARDRAVRHTYAAPAGGGDAARAEGLSFKQESLVTGAHEEEGNGIAAEDVRIEEEAPAAEAEGRSGDADAEGVHLRGGAVDAEGVDIQGGPLPAKVAEAEVREAKALEALLNPPPEPPKSWAFIALCVLCLLGSLLVFLVGLQLLGDSFKCLGGRGAGSMFTAIQSPITGLMTGILATVMVQSSSTSTSIVVGLVGADQISVKTGIPIIMGANIGTSVTNTIVSMGQAGNRLDLERAFSGATVHDMFNYLTVATLLPLELFVGAVQGEGGPLYWLTKAITNGIVGGDKTGELWTSPVKAVTSPIAKLVISNNKYVINGLSLGAPAAATPRDVDASVCLVRPRLAAPSRGGFADGSGGAGGGRALLSRRLAAVDCSQYYCVGKDLDKSFKGTSKKAYKKLTGCKGRVLDPAKPCGSGEKCYLDAGEYYRKYIQEKPVIKGGMLQGAGDTWGGIISLIISLGLLTGGLFCLTKVLHALFMGRAKRIIAKATTMNDYLAMGIGVIITIIVQSSSVTTSALTPFCGMGLLPLEKMFPLTLGANIGTTVTALIAALSKMTVGTVHIALCHLFFNILGILIWFPAPAMRRVPLSAARLLGLYASFYRAVPLIYMAVAFVLLPALAMGVSAVFGASVAAGDVVLLLLLGAFGGFEYWWVWRGGCYRVLSREDRDRGCAELARAQREVLGLPDAAVVGKCQSAEDGGAAPPA